METLHPLGQKPRNTNAGRAEEAGAGFSQVDLLTLIGVFVLLALLLTPALAHTQLTDRAFQCRNNLGRMLNAWRMYAEDNSDKVPSAWANPGDWWPGPDLHPPVNPTTDGTYQPNWNPDVTIKLSTLWPYCGNRQDIWRCPSDAIYPCLVTSGPLQGQYPRVRSYSMNDWFNGADASGFGSGFKIYLKLSDCLKPGPAMTLVFAHERVDSINDGEFVVGMTGYPDQPQSWRLLDLPTNVHDGACGFSFVDGHTEMHRWRDVALTIPMGHGPFVIAPSSQDAYWLMDHSTRKP